MQFLLGFADTIGERLRLKGPVACFYAQEFNGWDPSEGREIFSLAYAPKFDFLTSLVFGPGSVLLGYRRGLSAGKFSENVALALIANQFVVL